MSSIHFKSVYIIFIFCFFTVLKVPADSSNSNITNDEEEVETEEIIVTAPQSIINGGYFKNYGVKVEHANAVFLKRNISKLQIINLYFEDQAEHIKLLVRFVDTFNDVDKKNIYDHFQDLMKLFEYDKENLTAVNEIISLTATVQERRIILTNFIRSLYPDPGIKHSKAQMEKFTRYTQIKSSNEEALEDYVDQISVVIKRNNLKPGERKVFLEAQYSLKNILFMYFANAGVFFSCSDCP